MKNVKAKAKNLDLGGSLYLDENPNTPKIFHFEPSKSSNGAITSKKSCKNWTTEGSFVPQVICLSHKITNSRKSNGNFLSLFSLNSKWRNQSNKVESRSTCSSLIELHVILVDLKLENRSRQWPTLTACSRHFL